MLKIKDKYLGTIIAKGNTTIELNKDLTQKQLLWVKNMVNSEYVEEQVIEKVVKSKRKTKKSEDNVEDK